MKKTVVLIFLLCLIVQVTMAQKRSVSGIIREKATNETLPGVSVLEKGTKNGTVTNSDGRYELSVTEGATLVVSYIGLKTQEVKVGSNSTINVNLESSVETVDEVVVVGYGQQKKANLTGAVSSVDTKVLEARPIADVGRGLQGITPGLSVVVPSGEIGSDPILKIRGQFASLRGGTSPLILLDNVEIPSIQMVNPDDIESISVLKDAASSSIYGAKAAFGVILITTKKGAKTESVNVSYSGNLSFQNISKKMEMGVLMHWNIQYWLSNVLAELLQELSGR
jgi:TonB-dependent SusC/RagA subfamily outer membrane receptor